MIRILVAEDFDLIREDLCDTLEQQEDMTVVGSASTGEAIQALALDLDFDLILMDPPYGSGMLEKALETAAGIDILSENGIMVCESAAETLLPALSAPYRRGKDYRYGKIKLTVYHRDA